MIPRFGFIEAKKGVWEVVKISTGPWVQYADHEQALVEIERMNVANLQQSDEEHESDLAEKDIEITKWKAAHAEMVSRNRLLRDRPDLPADRICAHDEWVRKLAEKDQKIDTLKHEYAQLKEAYDAKASGVPLGPVVGAQTIVNQQIAYNKLMAQAVRFARLAGAHAPCQAAYDFLQSAEAQAFLKEHHGNLDS